MDVRQEQNKDCREGAFSHAIDKEEIPTVNILGVEVAAINMEWLMDFTQKNIRKLSGDYLCVSNVHTTVTACEDPAYREVQNGGILALPDGGPLSSLGRMRGYREMRRTTGPGYMDEVFRVSVAHGWRHYFYGSTEETIEKLRERLKKRYHGIEIVGMESPPFRPLKKEEDAATIERIRAAQPDFLWVGLGAPKQERWMAEHQGKVTGLMIGVGAGFDYFAGNIRRAPVWMQRLNMEWLYRLMQDPRRLFKRYVLTNTKFIWYAMIKGK